MKGISAVIATILMLMITIALAGTAYLYITGVFTSRTATVLSVDGQASVCSAAGLKVYVRNDGTTVSGNVSIDMTYPNGTIVLAVCNIGLINAGSTNSTTCTRTGPGATSGLYAVRATGSGSSTTGSLYCSS